MIDEVSGDLVDMVDAGTAARTEHYEIAAYNGLIEMARARRERGGRPPRGKRQGRARGAPRSRVRRQEASGRDEGERLLSGLFRYEASLAAEGSSAARGQPITRLASGSVRLVFTAYVVLIAVGLAFYIAIGITNHQ